MVCMDVRSVVNGRFKELICRRWKWRLDALTKVVSGIWIVDTWWKRRVPASCIVMCIICFRIIIRDQPMWSQSGGLETSFAFLVQASDDWALLPDVMQIRVDIISAYNYDHCSSICFCLLSAAWSKSRRYHRIFGNAYMRIIYRTEKSIIACIA